MPWTISPHLWMQGGGLLTWCLSCDSGRVSHGSPSSMRVCPCFPLERGLRAEDGGHRVGFIPRVPGWHSQRDAREEAQPSGLGSWLPRAECWGGRKPPNCPVPPGFLRAPGSALHPSTAGLTSWAGSRLSFSMVCSSP